MMHLLSEFDWNEKTIAVIGAFGVPIAAILGGLWFRLQKVRSEHELKRAMIERGMTAGDVERVMSAGREKE